MRGQIVSMQARKASGGGGVYSTYC